MKTRLVLMEPVTTRNEFNAKVTEWVERGTVHAERVRYTPKVSLQGGEVFADYQTRYNIRDGHSVPEGWRVRETGGHLYTVTAIERNRARGMSTLFCDRVND